MGIDNDTDTVKAGERIWPKTVHSVAAYQQRIVRSIFYSFAFFAALREVLMKKVNVYYDQEGHTLTVWFGNPEDEYICEETSEEIILMKNMSGQVIGFEKLHYILPQPADFSVVFETVAVAA